MYYGVDYTPYYTPYRNHWRAEFFAQYIGPYDLPAQPEYRRKWPVKKSKQAVASDGGAGTKKSCSARKEETLSRSRLYCDEKQSGELHQSKKSMKNQLKRERAMKKQASVDQQKPKQLKNQIEPNVLYPLKATPQVAKMHNHSPIRAPTPSPSNTSLQQKGHSKPKSKLICNLPPPLKPTKRSHFYLKDPPTPHQLKSIAQQFRKEIELLKFSLTTGKSSTTNVTSAAIEHGFIVAKILVGPSHPIAEHTFEFIRTEIVGWIGKYQHLKLDTPIFHSMANKESYITIVCENAYAYECLEQCIEEISKMRTVVAPISVLRLPQSSRLFCFGAVYAGIIHDPIVFLTQIKLHKTNLRADRWIVVSHEVRTQERQTNFIFLLDEQSALALTYHHNDKLYICMQTVEFTNRGCVEETH